MNKVHIDDENKPGAVHCLQVPESAVLGQIAVAPVLELCVPLPQCPVGQLCIQIERDMQDYETKRIP